MGPLFCGLTPLWAVVYLATVFQSQKASMPSSSQGTRALNTSNTSSTPAADQAERLISTFASSVMKRQRGSSGMGVKGLVVGENTLVI